MSTTSVQEYYTPLDKRLVTHLLRRCSYNFNKSTVDAYVNANMTASQIIDDLFSFDTQAEKYPFGPLNYTGSAQPYVYSPGTFTNVFGADNNKKQDATLMWKTIEAMYDTSARWKVIHWLHTLFPVRIKFEYYYHYWRLLLKVFQTDLKTITLKVSNDPQMMHYLNNDRNRVGAPNENFAREVLELMTIRRGENLGNGNYTNYTESDIQNAAKVLTGYQVFNNHVSSDPTFNEVIDTGVISGTAVVARHDWSEKVFSPGLVGTGSVNTIPATTNDADKTKENMYIELKQFYDIVFGNEETAKSFVRRMYQFFVRDEVDYDTELNVIEPLATELVVSGYDHIHVLKILLKSEHFFDQDDNDDTNEIIGAKIKSPWELMLQTFNQFEAAQLPDGSDQEKEDLFRGYFKIFIDDHFTKVGLDPRGPTTVEGYPGYYDAPSYSRNWFSSSNIYRRYSVSLSIKGEFIPPIRGNYINDFPFVVDLVDYVRTVFDDDNGPGPDPENPIGVANTTEFVTNFLSQFIPEMPNANRFEYFHEALLGGLSPINWYFSWKAFREVENDPNASPVFINEVTENVRVGLVRFIDSVLSSPEYQTY